MQPTNHLTFDTHRGREDSSLSSCPPQQLEAGESRGAKRMATLT